MTTTAWRRPYPSQGLLEGPRDPRGRDRARLASRRGLDPGVAGGDPDPERPRQVRGRREAAAALVRRLAMLHRFSFGGGRVSYANRFLHTNAYREAEQGRISYREFATDPCRSIFRRAATMFRPELLRQLQRQPRKLGDEYIAMTETPLPVAFDPETLDALGVAYDAARHPRHRAPPPRPRDRRAARLRDPLRASPRVRLYAQRDRSHQRRIGSNVSPSPPTCTASR